MTILTREECFRRLAEFNSKRKYPVMYSTVFGGLVKDVEAMVIPLDDHMVHRGDGIFEALRFHSGQIFDLDGHLNRLFRSAEMIGLSVPMPKEKISEVCVSVAEHSGLKDGMLRVFVSRGFGDFSPNPYSTTGSQLYVVAMNFVPVAPEKYSSGVKIGFSKVPVKPGYFAQVKSCNYLPNVMTKKEALDRGWDFAINLNENGFVAEGPTENIMVLTSSNELLAPRFDYTLRGTTLLKVLEIAEKNKSALGLTRVGEADLRDSDLIQAKEVMMVGTTLGVLPVTEVAGSSKGTAFFQKLRPKLSELYPQVF